jgi:hypothetical protein
MQYLLSHGERLDSFIEDNPDTQAARESEWRRSLSELEKIGVPAGPISEVAQ